MKPIYLSLLDIGLGFLNQYISSLTSSKAPAEVIAAFQAALTALQAHKSDVMSKADWEALRG